ncbi:MAG: hypothetical protein H6624_04995 [Bdellovibrionaceae bacterium]|nr:hypothetical protein [Bdellovibrionales bacterium]MCB9083675.1 hypothetical protein [Pseudobdellovibrionaceae bacterium]
MASLPAIDYERMEADRLATHEEELKKELQARVSSGGGHSSLRRMVLKLVTEGEYDLAQEEVEDYLRFRAKFPNFQSRCERYQEHCKDLIGAIRTKRNFPGLQTLSISKQQELHDKVIEHFDELKDYLKQIEMVEREVRMDDMRSTVWFIRTLFQCVLAVVGVAFFLDLTGGMASSFVIVVNKLLTDGASWLVSLF